MPAGTLGRLFALTAMIALPGIVAVLFMAVGSQWPPWTIALAIGFVVAFAAIVVFVYLRDMTALDRYIGGLGPLAGSGFETPPRVAGEAARRLSAIVGRLQGRWRRHDRVQSRRLEDARSIMEAIGDPLVLLTEGRVVVNANKAAHSLFGSGIKGRNLASVLRHPNVLATVDAVLADGIPKTVSYSTPVPVERVYQVEVNPFQSGGGSAWESGGNHEREPSDPAVLISLHDITKIKRSEQMRADFVANASHELRTPLSALSGFIETLAGPARDDVDARDRFLKIMGQQAERMARLVQDLLSLSHIELDEHSPPQGRCDVRQIVNNVVAVLEIKAAERQMTIAVDAPDDFPDVNGDPDQLTQVFQNLVANAIAYGRGGTEVTITLRQISDTDRIAITLQDRGEGMAGEHLPRLTERFYRVDPARSRALGGTGLGLAIVKHIVIRHRGRLTVESVVGEGSIFTVLLPASPEGSPRSKTPGDPAKSA